MLGFCRKHSSKRAGNPEAISTTSKPKALSTMKAPGRRASNKSLRSFFHERCKIMAAVIFRPYVIGVRQTLPISDQVEAATLWSAATCRRFGLRRLDAGDGIISIKPWPGQVATDQSADRSAHSKEVTTR